MSEPRDHPDRGRGVGDAVGHGDTPTACYVAPDPGVRRPVAESLGSLLWGGVTHTGEVASAPEDVDCLVVDPAADPDLDRLSAHPAPVVVYTRSDRTLPARVLDAADAVVGRGTGEASRRRLCDRIRELVADDRGRGRGRGRGHSPSRAPPADRADAPSAGETAYALLEDGTVTWEHNGPGTLAPDGVTDSADDTPTLADRVEEAVGHGALAGDTDDRRADDHRITLAGRQYRLETRPMDGGRRLLVVRDVTDALERADRLSTFESLVADAQDGLYTLDETGTIQFCNSSFAALFGYEVPELRGEHITTVFTEEAFEEGRRAVDRLRSAETDSVRIDLTAEHRDGSRVAVALHLTVRRSSGGRFEGITGVARDVTDQRERQRELERATARYETLVENFPDGAVFLFDEEMRFHLAGGAGLEAAGFAAEDFEGHTLHEALPPALADHQEPYYRRALSGEEVSFEQEFEGQMYRIQVLPVREGEEVVGGLTVAQNVTDRRERRLELERANARYETLVEHFPDGGVFLFDDDLTYTLAGGTELGGEALSPAEFEGATPQEVFDGELADRLTERYRRALAGERSVLDLTFADEQYEVAVVPVRDTEGTAVAGMAVAQNVTDRRERERELQRYETLVNAATDPMVAVDADDRVRLANDAFLGHLGLARGTVIDADVSVLAEEGGVDDTAVATWHEVREDLRGPGTDSREFEVETGSPTGEEGRHVFEGEMVSLPDGGVIAVLRDVTERAEREAELRRVRDRTRLALEATDAVAWSLDTDSGDVTYHPPDSEALYGERVDSRAAFFEQIHPDDRDRVRAAVERAIERGTPYEEAFRTETDGGVEWRLARGRVATDDRGEPVRMYGVTQDITGRKEREAKLRRVRERMELALEATDSTVWDWDVEADEVRFYPRSPGTDDDSMSIEAALSAVHPADRDRVRTAVEEAVETGERFATEFRVETGDGVRWLADRGAVEDPEGSPVAYGVVQDITERTAREQALRHERDKLARLETVVGSIQPLTETLTTATSHGALETALCARLADSTAYDGAWIGGSLRAGHGMKRRAGDGALSALEDWEREAVATAVNAGTPGVESHGDRAVVAVPLSYRATSHGVLVVRPAGTTAVTDLEEAVLSGLGRRVGQALTALENRQLIEGDSLLEVRFRDTDRRTPLARAATAFDCRLDVRDLTRVDEDVLLHTAVDGADPEAVAGALADRPAVRFARVTRTDGPETGTVQWRFAGDCPLAVLADHGGAIRTARFDPEETSVVADFAPGTDTTAVADATAAVCPGFEPVSKRERERERGGEGDPERGPDPAPLRERLTDRQREVLEAAYHAGYYDWPRGTTAEDLADALGIASPTLHQHLRKAHGRLADTLVGGTGVS